MKKSIPFLNLKKILTEGLTALLMFSFIISGSISDGIGQINADPDFYALSLVSGFPWVGISVQSDIS
ncbi:hypothetical protein [Cyclobacterium sp.]|uniref:hypothetical protein n=1 Tax=Cyclobacterium sp. TaxID=1966343 RepID=UPI0019C783C1|nr:hypothetical protein [Cyclobacterium sp.]MBD3627210.1 hypothetical protein [Cyclobacterium sp.]